MGSDTILFFHKKGFVSSIKKVIKLENQVKLYFLLVFPKIKCRTNSVYLNVKKYSVIKNLIVNEINSKKDFLNYIINSKNDLQSIVENKHPVIGDLTSHIRSQKGCFTARMTGSGSCCYGLFIDENCSKVALNSLKKKYPKFWFSIAKTI